MKFKINLESYLTVQITLVSKTMIDKLRPVEQKLPSKQTF